jgi:Quinohemoprotein amine dehydrogenase, alpha subunit domain III
VNSLLLNVNVSVDPAAALTARMVTVINPDGGRSSSSSALTVTAAPSITSLSPTARGQGAVNETIVITGTNFRSGSWSSSYVTFSGAGIIVNAVSRTDSTHLSVNLSIASSAATGARNVTVRNVDRGRATLVGGFTVTTGPAITSLSPSSRPQGATSQAIVITGANFAAGSWPTSAVMFSGSGITVNSVSRTDATHLTINVTVSSSAATGARDVTVRNLDGGRATRAGAFTVNVRPTLTSLSPNSRARGQSNQTIVLTGTGFVNGATVSLSGSGITVNSVTWNSATKLTINVSVSSGASTGNRNVTVTNPDQGAVTLSNGFRVT